MASPKELSVNPSVHKYNRKLEAEKARNAKMSSRNEDFVYVNPSFVGSMNSVSGNRLDGAPPASVIREQYWTCARWPSTQRMLVITVAILLGIVIGLGVTMIIRRLEPDLAIFGARA